MAATPLLQYRIMVHWHPYEHHSSTIRRLHFAETQVVAARNADMAA
jgi:hypothetical protein